MVILLHRAKDWYELLHRYLSAGSMRDVGIVVYKQLQGANRSVLPAFNWTGTLFRNAPVSFSVCLAPAYMKSIEWTLIEFDMQYF